MENKLNKIKRERRREITRTLNLNQYNKKGRYNFIKYYYLIFICIYLFYNMFTHVQKLLSCIILCFYYLLYHNSNIV